MEEIIKKLKDEIVNHDLVKNSSLFSAAQWKRAHYIILSEIISEALSKSEFLKGAKKNDLGISISSSTLQRVFTNSYTDKGNSDLRFLKTLDKLAIFLGYQNLNSFLLHQGANEKVQFKEKKVKAKAGHNNIKGHDVSICFFKDMIVNSCQAIFDSMKNLPVFDIGRFSDYVFEQGPIYIRGYDLLLKFSELNLYLSCENNRSNFEIYGFKVHNVNEDSVVIKSKEFWNFNLVDENGKIVYIYNKANNQLYFFRKINGVWKIWDNHNPGYDSLASNFFLK